MKTILYICGKNQYDWDAVFPQKSLSPMEMATTVVLVQEGRNLKDVPTPHVYTLKSDGEVVNDASAAKMISYQDFLEKIFLSDLAVML